MPGSTKLEKNSLNIEFVLGSSVSVVLGSSGYTRLSWGPFLVSLCCPCVKFSLRSNCIVLLLSAISSLSKALMSATSSLKPLTAPMDTDSSLLEYFTDFLSYLISCINKLWRSCSSDRLGH